MSLRVWLPLTDGTLKQQGLSNSVVTSSGTVVLTNAGKLGKCATFGSAAGGLTIPASAMTSFTNACSVAFWLKINGWGNSYDTYFQAGLGSSPWAHYIFGFLRNNANSTICFTISNGTNASNANYLSSALSTGVWYHVALTYETGKCKIYLNGSLDHEYSTSIVPNFSGITKITLGRCNNSSYQTQCGMNDVRIYDHCLSPLEVKEISQGLVLHYPLNGYLGSAPNLLSKYVTPGQSAPGSTSTAGRTNYYGNYGIIIPATENADTYFRLFLNKQLESGKTYTISCNVSGLLSGSYYRFPLFAQSNTSMGVLDLNHNGLCSLTFTMNWTGTQTAVSKDGRNIYVCFLDDSGRAIASGQGPITVTNFKIEEGSVVTPFSPDFYDVGLDTTKITDESGFGYNGTVTGTLNYNSDSQRYNVSAHFNGSTYIHLTPPTAEIKTFSVWVNWDSIPSGQSVVLVDNGSQMGLGLMSTGILCSTSGAGNSYTFSKSSLVANTWYHFVVVETGTTTRKLYINGVEQSPTSNTSNWTYSVNELQLGKRSTTSDGFIGKLSDFRAYATALSEADIKALYITSANIDNFGNFHSFEFVEDDKKSIDKNGITHAYDIVEYKLLERLKYDKTIYKEPDGSSWIRVAHHNDPTTSGYFSRTDDWDNGVYLSADKWYNMDAIESVSTWEFMVKQKTTSSATEAKYRWVQYKSPFTAAWADVKPGTVTFNTSTGYSSSSYGGLWQMNSSARLCIANGSSSNWFGAFGCWTTYNTNNIPGYPNSNISTGYMDLYVRVPDANIKDDGTFTANEFIEK